jgi:hypothetical protein
MVARIISFFVLVTAVYFFQKCKSGDEKRNELAPDNAMESAPNNSTTFSCTGKTSCREMTSCSEATFYLNNCPNVRIDGDGDGIPCEDQWCGH